MPLGARRPNTRYFSLRIGFFRSRLIFAPIWGWIYLRPFLDFIYLFYCILQIANFFAQKIFLRFYCILQIFNVQKYVAKTNIGYIPKIKWISVAIFLWGINRLLHRKCAVRIFIHESQNFRNERMSVANEWVSKVLQRANKIRTKHFLWCNLFVIQLFKFTLSDQSLQDKTEGEYEILMNNYQQN